MATNASERTFDVGRLAFTFRDGDGRAIASFSVDPTDAGLPDRAREVAEFFSEARDCPLSEYNDAVEERICYMLGYDAREELFSHVSATTVSTDGELFALAVLDAVAENVAPELRRRAALMRERAAAYTDKYARHDG